MVPIAAVAAVFALAFVAVAGAQTQPGVDALLMQVSDRVAGFYNRAKNIVCIERSTVQPIDASHSTVGFPRTVESELHVESGTAPGEAVFVRNVRNVNGRAPRPQDSTDRAGCTDPNPLTPEPLAFLLPQHRSAYEFSPAGVGKDRNRTAHLVDFASVDRRSTPVLIEDPNGHEDCFDWAGPVAVKGRVWVDADTYDVLRVDRRLFGPVDVKVPILLGRRYRFDPWVTLVRDDLTVRYQAVAFSDPDEVMLLPESITSLTMIRGGLQSTRRSQTFSDYKRFVTKGKVLD